MRERLDIAAVLRDSYLFEGLPQPDVAALAALSPARTFGRGAHIFRFGDPAEEIYVIASGEVKDSVVNEDGEEVIHFVHRPGQTFGEPGFFAVERNRILEVIAVEQSVLVRLERRRLVPFMAQHPVIKDRVLERLASNTRLQTAMISALATRPLVNRLVLRLLELAKSNPEGVGGAMITPKISQSTLAAMTGGSRENVNRALSALAAQGLIKREAGRYVLLDEEGLRAGPARDFPVLSTRDKIRPQK